MTTNNTLYIIGNGFDLYHGLDTWYTSFGLYLKENREDIYEYFLNYFGFLDLDEEDEDSLKDPLWSHFEASLAGLNIEEVLSDHAEYAADPGSDDFSDGDWNTIAVYVSEIRDKLTVDLLKVFKDFIRKVEYPKSISDKLLNIDRNAFFISFNYTSTLEYYYNVPPINILYIHNKADAEEPLILGHGMNPNDFKTKDPKPPEGLNEEELYEWRDAMADNYDHSMELGKQSLIQYFSKSFKSTDSVIKQNQNYFKTLNKIDTVIVLGHSLAPVDEAYFKKIISSVNSNAKWIVSYRNPDEIDARKHRLIELGINQNNIELVKMTDLK